MDPSWSEVRAAGMKAGSSASHHSAHAYPAAGSQGLSPESGREGLRQVIAIRGDPDPAAPIPGCTGLHRLLIRHKFSKQLPRMGNDDLLPGGDCRQELREMRLRLRDIYHTYGLLLLV